MALKVFAGQDKIYTSGELFSDESFERELVFRENHNEDGTFRFIGYRGNLELKLPDKHLIDAGAIHAHQMIHKFGRAVGPAINQWSNVWNGGGLIPFTGVNLTTPTLVSTEAADTQTIQVKGLVLEDGDWNIVSYDITLTGDTPIAIPGDIMTVYRMTNIGTTDLTGDVTLQDGAIVYAKILAGIYNSTQMSIFPIPTGYIGLVVEYSASIDTGKSAQIAFRYKSFGLVAKLAMIFDLTGQKITEQVYYSFDEKTIMDAVCYPTVAGTDVSASFDVILIEKPWFERVYHTFKGHNNIG